MKHKRFRLLGWLLGLALGLGALAVPARAGEAPQPPAASPEPYSGSVACPPALYGAALGPCVSTGPAAYLAQWQQLGFPYGGTDFPGVRLPLTWLVLPTPETRYAWVTAERLRLYATAQDAVEETDKPLRGMGPGFMFIAYDAYKRLGTRAAYRTTDGYWVNSKAAEPVTPSTFRGVLFPTDAPTRPFGWVRLREVRPKATPGRGTWDYAPYPLRRYQLVQVYDTRTVDDQEWLLVGPDLWVEETAIATVTPRTAPPEGVPADRWIAIDVYEQTLAVYQDRRLVFATMISSGTGEFYTRQGVFQIQTKLATEDMRGAFTADKKDFYYLEDVPWTMYYDGARAIHGAYWHDGFGFKQSHGCVNLSVADAYWVFQWAHEGDWVYVWDPTGETPFE